MDSGVMTMATKDITSIRGTLAFLEAREQLIKVTEEVNPVLEIAGIQKALDEGPALLFENIKGYPGVKCTGNLLCRDDNLAAIFGVDNYKHLKFRCVEAINNPIPPIPVQNPPCQEVMITKDLNVMNVLPIYQHSPDDGGRLLGGGIVLVMPPVQPQGTELAFKRMNFRGPDWSSLHIQGSSHLGNLVYGLRKGENIPLTVNIGLPPSVMLIAGASTLHSIIPNGSDELGIAGALQGTPVEITKAKTVDAYAIANAEYVIEGYLTPNFVWETEEAEKLGRVRVAPFFPEWAGYLGRASRDLKFQATAITHRKDKPIFYDPLAHSFEVENLALPFREACYLEQAERFWPGLVKDLHIPHCFKQANGVVYQVKKRSRADSGAIRNILQISLADSLARLVIAVDDDVNIYRIEDVIWAIITRTNFNTGLFKSMAGALGMSHLPWSESLKSNGSYGVNGMAVDATLQLDSKSKRGHYISDVIDLRKWFSEEQIEKVRAKQSEYCKFLASTGG